MVHTYLIATSFPLSWIYVLYTYLLLAIFVNTIRSSCFDLTLSIPTEHLLKFTFFFKTMTYSVKWHENIGYSCLCTLKRVVHESNSLTCVKCMTHINYNGRKRDLIHNSFESSATYTVQRQAVVSCQIWGETRFLMTSWKFFVNLGTFRIGVK